MTVLRKGFHHNTFWKYSFTVFISGYSFVSRVLDILKLAFALFFKYDLKKKLVTKRLVMGRCT